MSVLIKGGRIITAADDYVGDVFAEGETISLIGESLDVAADKVIDAAGKYVFPGAIDPHTHIEMFFGGTTTCDDFTSGTVAAAFGGTTSLVDFCMQAPGTPFPEALDNYFEKIERCKPVIDVGFHIGVTDIEGGGGLDALAKLPDEGITSYKLFMAYKGAVMVDDETLFKTMQVARETGGLVMVHAENGDAIDVIVKNAVAEGKTDPIWHARTRPMETEAEATNRAVQLARVAGCSLYVVHVSCQPAVEPIALAREKPDWEGGKYIYTPPPRPKEHQEHLWKALVTDDLSVVSTDHCPFNWPEQKGINGREFEKVPNGGPGAGAAVRHLLELAPVYPLLLRPVEGAVVGGDDREVVRDEGLPQVLLVLLRPRRRRVDVLPAFPVRLLPREGDRLHRGLARHVDDVERAPRDAGQLDRPVRSLGLRLHRARPRVPDRIRLPLRDRVLDDHVDGVAVLGVHHHEAAGLSRDLHRLEERLVVDHDGALVRHEQLVRGDALVGQLRERVEAAAALDVGDADVEADVDDGLAALDLLEVVVERLGERSARRLHAEVDERRRPPERGGDGARREVVARRRATEEHLDVSVWVDRAGEHVLPGGVDHLVGGDVERLADQGDRLALGEDVADVVVRGRDDATALDQYGHGLTSFCLTSTLTLIRPRQQGPSRLLRRRQARAGGGRAPSGPRGRRRSARRPPPGPCRRRARTPAPPVPRGSESRRRRGRRPRRPPRRRGALARSRCRGRWPRARSRGCPPRASCGGSGRRSRRGGGSGRPAEAHPPDAAAAGCGRAAAGRSPVPRRRGRGARSPARRRPG